MKHHGSIAIVVALLTACGSSPPPPSNLPATPGAAVPGAAAAPPATAAPPSPPPRTAAQLQPLVDAPDRTEEDRKLDAGRHPAETLAFFGISPGMKVADLSAGGGYTTEFLVRAVGPSGVVYGQNSPGLLARFAEKPWSERLRRPIMQHVVRLDREFEDPLPPEAHDLDAVLMVLFYHDLFWLKADRDKMNRAVFQALKPGGIFGVVDHSARPGKGATEVETLHRIEESIVRAEIEKAGFRLQASGDFLRRSDDARDWSASPRTAGERRGTSDRFVLAFVKPNVP